MVWSADHMIFIISGSLLIIFMVKWILMGAKTTSAQLLHLLATASMCLNQRRWLDFSIEITRYPIHYGKLMICFAIEC